MSHHGTSHTTNRTHLRGRWRRSPGQRASVRPPHCKVPVWIPVYTTFSAIKPLSVAHAADNGIGCPSASTSQDEGEGHAPRDAAWNSRQERQPGLWVPTEKAGARCTGRGQAIPGPLRVPPAGLKAHSACTQGLTPCSSSHFSDSGHISEAGIATGPPWRCAEN